ncbi:hypothetical protein [Chroococcidiopsis sp. CCALA 051]|uniref:hypothetical protein n=1 Tax=Chroococcidiopsis sp. CCALA 051 TaxID=869949 RepID=UPI0018ECC856|nr:hypothetical protein [Chroococcidiopsis sp. CCALA 051]
MNKKQLTAMLVPFYLGEQPDIEGRTIQQIWVWDFEDLECEHDYMSVAISIAREEFF